MAARQDSEGDMRTTRCLLVHQGMVVTGQRVALSSGSHGPQAGIALQSCAALYPRRDLAFRAPRAKDRYAMAEGVAFESVSLEPTPVIEAYKKDVGGVEFIVIGGFAATARSADVTADLDPLCRPSLGRRGPLSPTAAHRVDIPDDQS
jgi:hypothetical protein